MSALGAVAKCGWDSTVVSKPAGSVLVDPTKELVEKTTLRYSGDFSVPLCKETPEGYVDSYGAALQVREHITGSRDRAGTDELARQAVRDGRLEVKDVYLGGTSADDAAERARRVATELQNDYFYAVNGPVEVNITEHKSTTLVPRDIGGAE